MMKNGPKVTAQGSEHDVKRQGGRKGPSGISLILSHNQHAMALLHFATSRKER